MILSRTPFRISFFGGGTDYPSWYLKHGGSVLATTINKYCYISCRWLPPFFEHRIRVVYSKIENCQSFEEIQHPAVREILRFLSIHNGIEIHHDGDLPARSGMGSSSAFTVGLMHALYGLSGTMPSKNQLASNSIRIEQEILRETVGSQDQISAAYGGFNQIIFKPNGDFVVRPITIATERLAELNRHLMLFYTGIKRTASDVAKSYIKDFENNNERLQEMHGMVKEGLAILNGTGSIQTFGELLHESWELKRGLGGKVSNGVVDDLYANARANGAIGGKITGAGGGGFLLLFVPPVSQENVRRSLRQLLHVPFKFDNTGSQIIFYEPEKEDYLAMESIQDRSAIAAFREMASIGGKGSGN
ncbi:MAG TPA: hypothetical protein PLO63_02180 [Syntrophales bacterium]|nr:hypothetical protein [Syntrophales bacterium]